MWFGLQFLGVEYTGSAFGSWALDTDFSFRFFGFGYMDGFIDFLDSYLPCHKLQLLWRGLEYCFFSKNQLLRFLFWPPRFFWISLSASFVSLEINRFFGSLDMTPAYNINGIPDNFKIV
ncbi:unnamed protein product [Rhizophagus irregularis]|nr:unnamed protein product [Rhizophagus irregularis]